MPVNVRRTVNSLSVRNMLGQMRGVAAKRSSIKKSRNRHTDAGTVREVTKLELLGLMDS